MPSFKPFRMHLSEHRKEIMCLHYPSPEVSHIPLAEAKKQLAGGHFPKGSMQPKIESAIRFLESGGKISIVTSPRLAGEALSGQAGTIITPDGINDSVEHDWD